MQILKYRLHIKKLENYAGRDDVDLWALDEVHFQQYGSSIRMWVPSDIRDPILLHHPTRKKVGYFGAVRLRDGELVVSQEQESFNAVTTLAFLEKLEECSRESGKQIVVILDNARFHHAKLHKEWREGIAKTFLLEFLPAYSPELNPIERVWKLTRRICIHNQYFETLEVLIQSIEKQFENWSHANESLRKLCAIT